MKGSDEGRMGLSVEGKIVERDAKNPRVITKCQISAVALTMNPVNSDTYAGLVKSMSDEAVEFNSTEESFQDEEVAVFTVSQVLAIVEKAMSISGGYTKPPNSLTDGDAMTTSDMKAPGKKKKRKRKERVILDVPDVVKGRMRAVSSEIYKSMMINVLDKLQSLYPDSTRSELWEAVKFRLETKFPEVYSASEEK